MREIVNLEAIVDSEKEKEMTHLLIETQEDRFKIIEGEAAIDIMIRGIILLASIIKKKTIIAGKIEEDIHVVE